MSKNPIVLVTNFEESVIRLHATDKPSRIDREYYEFSRKDLLDYIDKLKALADELVNEGAKLGLGSDRWDVKVNEYRQWDL